MRSSRAPGINLLRRAFAQLILNFVMDYAGKVDSQSLAGAHYPLAGHPPPLALSLICSLMVGVYLNFPIINEIAHCMNQFINYPVFPTTGWVNVTCILCCNCLTRFITSD